MCDLNTGFLTSNLMSQDPRGSRMVQWKGLKSVCCGEPRLLQYVCTIIVQPVDSNFTAVSLYYYTVLCYFY